MLRYCIVSLLVAALYTTDALKCYRCFGSDWCNNSTDPRFLSNVHQIDCPATNSAYNYDGYAPLLMDNILKHFQKEYIKPSDNDILNDSQWGCVTATLHEANETHTVRTCLNSASTICPAIRNVVLNPILNDISPDISLDCEGCTDNLCNNQTFVESEEVESSSTTSSSSTAEASSPPTTLEPSSTAEASSPSTNSEPSSLSTTSTSHVTEESSTSSSSGPESSTQPGAPTSSETPSDPTSPSSPSSGIPETTEGQDETTLPDSGHSLVVSYLILAIAIVLDFFVL